MEIETVVSEKDNLKIKINNVTVAEIIRVYLQKGGVDFVAWKREHPSKPVIMKIQSSKKTIKKVISEAVSNIKKDCVKFSSVVKK